MEALVSLHIHPNKPTKWLVFGSAIYVVCNMMETLASLRIHLNKATKRVVEMLINTSTQVLHQLGFNSHFQPSLPSNPQTYRRIIAPSWGNC